MAVTDERTRASELRELGGGGLPEPALTIFHDYDIARAAIVADTKISDLYRNEQLQALDDKTDRKLRQSRDADVAAKAKEYDEREGKVLGQIKGTVKSRDFELDSDQRERHFRTSQETTSMLVDLMNVTSMMDPDELRDLYEEAIESGKPERVRKIAPAIVGRLETLKRRKVIGAEEAHGYVAVAYMGFKQKNPSLTAQLRQIRKERQGFERPIDAKYVRAREHFRFGKHAQGMQL